MKERKKILWLTSWYPNKADPFDGDFIQRHARAAAIYHDIHVICVKQNDQEEYESEYWSEATGLKEQIIYYRKQNGLLASLKNHQRWKKLFRRAIRSYLKNEGKPAYIHVHIPWKAGLMGIWMKKEFGLPFLITEHWGMYYPKDQGFVGNHPLKLRYLKRSYQEAKESITVSQYLSNGIWNVTGTRSRIIPNVVDTTLFYPGQQKYSKFTFVHVSNMVPLKRVDVILEAFHELTKSHSAQLILIGNKNDDFVKLASELGILNSSVFFRGEISYREVAEEIRRCHALVLFSESETFSCVTAEALCAGLPVLAAATGALPELVEEGKNGLLVLPEYYPFLEGMKNMISRHTQFNPSRIAANAASKYSYEAVSGAFDALYNGLLPKDPFSEEG